MLRCCLGLLVVFTACASPLEPGDLQVVQRAADAAATLGAITIVSTSVDCVGDTVQFGMHVEGITGDGLVFMQETANAGPHLAEEHDLVSVDSDPAVPFDDLAQSLLEDASYDDQMRNEASLFRCRHHFEADDVMTYAFVALDVTGNVADCVVWGHDPDGLIDETYPRVAEPSVDLSSCRVATPGGG